jgi:hypothetical protein
MAGRFFLERKFFMIPNPEDFYESIGRLKEAFQAAADKYQGEPNVFAALNSAYNNALDAGPDLEESLRSGDRLKALAAGMKVAGTFNSFKKALVEAATIAESDPHACEVLNELRSTINTEMQNLGGGILGGMGGLGGGYDDLPGTGALDPGERDEPREAPKKPAPKRKPKGGSIDL